MSNFIKFLYILSIFVNFFHGHTSTEDDSDQNFWKNQGLKAIQDSVNAKRYTGKAKNVILFVGDGMGLSTVTAGRIFKGQQKGHKGEEGFLTFEKFENVGLLKTYNTDRQTPDSAATATAIFTGVKTKMFTLGYDGKVTLNSCTPDLEKSKLTSIMDWAIKEKKRTGIVTTTRITHATPSSTYAHSPHRDWECDGKIPIKERGKTCIDIGRQLVETEPGMSINVLFGGGEQVLRGTMNVTQTACYRTDGKDLIQTWLDSHTQKGHKPKFIKTKGELLKLAENEVDHVMGLFHPCHMPYDKDRDQSEKGHPSLEEMTTKALKILKLSQNGFLLIVEGGRIDHGHHANLAKIALEELVAFDLAIESALNLIDLKETLVIVTADHSHAFAISGYASRGNDITGVSDYPTSQGFLYQTLGYINGPGYSHHRLNGTNSSTSTLNTWRNYNGSKENATHRHEPHFAGFYTSDETHGGEDVPVYSTGPMSHLLQGVHEQTHISYVIGYAACLGPFSGEKCAFKGKQSEFNSAPKNSGFYLFSMMMILTMVLLF